MCNCKENDFELVPELQELISTTQDSFLPRMNSLYRTTDSGWEMREFEAPASGQPVQGQSTVSLRSGQSCLSRAFNLIPKYFNPELVSCIKTRVLSDRTKFLLNLSLRERGINWAKKIKPDVDIFKEFPTVEVTIELFHFIPIDPRNPDLVSALRRYMNVKSRFYSAVIGDIQTALAIETGLQVPLAGLFRTAGIDPKKLSLEEAKSYIIVAYVSFPDSVSKFLRQIDYINLNKFEFDKSALVPFHLPMIKRIGYDIFESWWDKKKILTVKIKGHADERGDHKYNDALGLKRAKSVELQLRQELDKIVPAYAKSTLLKLNYIIESAGKRKPVSRLHELNRRVEVKLEFTVLPTEPPLNLDEVIVRCIKYLNTYRVSSDPQVKRLICVLQKMQLAGIDDRFVSGGQSVLNIQNVNRFPGPAEWNRVRFHLVNPNIFGPSVHHVKVLKALDWLDEQIIEVKDKVNQIIALQGGATANSIRQLRTWLEDRVKNNKSIYSCYKGIY